MNQQNLREDYFFLYGEKESTKRSWERLRELIASAKEKRREVLKKEDEEEKDWYRRQDILIYQAYTDYFAGDLKSTADRIPYLKSLGIRCLHLLPSAEHLDEGAIPYRYYGSMEEVRALADRLREENMMLSLTVNLNHTEDNHPWAIKAKAGSAAYRGVYYIFDTEEMPKEYEKTMEDLLPQISPGNFTYNEEIQAYVMTRFRPNEWDLNYTNPKVFNLVMEQLLLMANDGVRLIQLEALPYLWNRLGTGSVNLPQVHILLRMFRSILEEVAPSVVLAGDVDLTEKVLPAYFGNEAEPECKVLYNTPAMVHIWNSLATRDVRLMQKSLMRPLHEAREGVWLNYIRSFKEISFEFNDDDLRSFSFDPLQHRQFLLQFYLGKFDGSFASGRAYSFDSVKLNAKVCGSLTALTGWEKATKENDMWQAELAARRIALVYGMIFALPGMPMIYSGDEVFQQSRNLTQEELREDSRRVHRQSFDWDKASHLTGAEELLSRVIHRMIEIRGKEKVFASDTPVQFIDTWNKGVLGFRKGGELLFYGNFTEEQQYVKKENCFAFHIYDAMQDLIYGKTVRFDKDILLGPYEFFWLVPEQNKEEA